MKININSRKQKFGFIIKILALQQIFCKYQKILDTFNNFAEKRYLKNEHSKIGERVMWRRVIPSF